METSHPSPDAMTKQWQQALAHYRQITDEAGMSIDPGILETVVALNLLRIPTYSSCEGHLTHGSGAPYVDSHPSSMNPWRYLEEQAKAALAEAQKQQALRHSPEEQIQQLFVLASQLQQELTRHYLEARLTLLHYLSRFYADRQVPYDRRLVVQGWTIQGIPGSTRLESQGASVLQAYDKERRAQKLRAYQEEMCCFTDFLKAQLHSGQSERAIDNAEN